MEYNSDGASQVRIGRTMSDCLGKLYMAKNFKSGVLKITLLGAAKYFCGCCPVAASKQVTQEEKVWEECKFANSLRTELHRPFLELDGECSEGHPVCPDQTTSGLLASHEPPWSAFLQCRPSELSERLRASDHTSWVRKLVNGLVRHFLSRH